jgi:hypothetical protein
MPVAPVKFPLLYADGSPVRAIILPPQYLVTMLSQQDQQAQQGYYPRALTIAASAAFSAAALAATSAAAAAACALAADSAAALADAEAGATRAGRQSSYRLYSINSFLPSVPRARRNFVSFS